jgi:hypothetical protein
MRIPFISMIAAGALALGGCAYGDLGLGGYGSPYYSSGYGSPYYSNYGYPGSGISIGVGYGSGYGGYGYGSPYYGGYGYGSPYGGGLGSYYGWNSGYYYPGTGYYVYDSYRRPYAMTTSQRQYWSTRSPALRTTGTTTTTGVKPNWSAFSKRQTARAQRQAASTERKTAREQRRADRRDNR